MFHSLELLKHLPGHEDRQENCHKFRSTLLDALRPNVQKELSTMNTAALQEYAYVFRKLGSDDEFKQIYAKQRPAHLLLLWSEIKRGESFSEWIALYLGTVGRFVQEEEAYITELFGAEQLPYFCTTMLSQTLDPLDKLLPSQLTAYNDVNTIFECYLVLEEFGRRNILTLDACSVSERWQLLDGVFSGLWKFLPAYVDVEERVLRRGLYQALDRVSLITAVQDYQDQTGLIGIDDVEPIEVMSLYCDRLVQAVQSVLRDIFQFIDRVAQIFGGIALKTALRSVANLLQTTIKSLALKLGNIALALGVNDFSQGFISAGGGAFEPFASYLDENSFAQNLSERIFGSEISRQSVMAAALHAYKVSSQVLILTTTIEGRIRELSARLQQQVQWQQSIDWSSPSSIATVLSSRSEQSQSSFSQVVGHGMSSRVGVWFGQWKLQRDIDSCSELRSFLATCPAGAGAGSAGASANSGSASSLHYQGIFSTTQLLLQRLELKTKEMILVIGTRQPEKIAGQYASEECWQRNVGNVTTETVMEVQNQLLPLSVVTQIGEHLLSLVQDLEGFAGNLENLEEMSAGDMSDETAATMRRLATLILATSTDIAQISSASLSALVEQCVSLVSASLGWKTVKEKLMVGDTKSLRQLSDRGQVSKLLTVFDKEVSSLGMRSWNIENSEDSSTDVAQVGASGFGEGAGFVNEWLMLFSDALVGVLLAQVLQLPSTVSLYGTAQLLTDIDYFWNVIHATGIKPHPLFGHIKKLLLIHLQHPGEVLQVLKGIAEGKSATVLKDLLKLYSNILH
jgi:hypothetical protein